MCSLTILIPTYNRCLCLEKLLASLCDEIIASRLAIMISVFNNASSDSTDELLANYSRKHSFINFHTNRLNVGPDMNFLLAIQSVQTKFFWLLGDDDYPIFGTLTAICNLISSEHPDLLYMPSLWHPQAYNVRPATKSSFEYSQFPLPEFARLTHVWSTFISSWVVNKAKLDAVGFSPLASQRLINSSFIQLSWIYPLFQPNNKFISLSLPCIYATAGNSGGYSLINTFGINFSRITSNSFNSNTLISSIIINNFCLRFFWRLVANRYSLSYLQMDSDPVKFREVMSCLRSSPWFWLICFPLLLLPASFLRLASSALTKSKYYLSKSSSLFA